MLLAYLDEVGEPGPFISHEHPTCNTSAAFGYAGFIIPEESARHIGAIFTSKKRELFASLLEEEEHAEWWEQKGAQVFRKSTVLNYPNQLRVFSSIVRNISRAGGRLFYYVDEKQIGTLKQTRIPPEDREHDAMREALNRIARHAAKEEEHVLVLLDQVDEKVRKERLWKMYAHIFARSSEFQEMRRIVEPPMHLDSPGVLFR